MGKYVTYDVKERVIFADFTNLTLTPALMQQLFEETREIAVRLPHKVCALSCWHNTTFDVAVMEEVQRAHMSEMLKYVTAVFRYETTDPFANVSLRFEAVHYGFQGGRSHIYASRADALAAIRQLERDSHGKNDG